MMTALNNALTKCTDCHGHTKLRGRLLTTGCNPVPPLTVPMREWFPARGWAGTTTPGPKALLILGTNPGHPLDVEGALWSDWPATVAASSSVSTEQGAAELELVSKLYRDPNPVPNRTAFHTRSVQVARSLLWLIGRSGHKKTLQASWFDNVWFSDVIKCSTAKERGSPGVRGLAKACRVQLKQELDALDPEIVVTLGSVARDAVALGDFGRKTLACPHPSGWHWRRIDGTEGDVERMFQDACSSLEVEYERVKSELLGVRTALHLDPWGSLEEGERGRGASGPGRHAPSPTRTRQKRRSTS